MTIQKTKIKEKTENEKSSLPSNNQDNTLKKILREVITLVVGKQAEEIVDLLDTKKHVNEFLLAKKLDLTINQTRNILYKISDHGLVSYIRKKDKKKGWYTYFWKIEVLKSLKFMKNVLIKKIGQLKHKIKSRETKRFYVCDRCAIEITEEHALICNFTCNECGDILSLKDNVKLIRDMKKNFEKLKKELEFLEEEIIKETEKVEKIKLKEIKKEKAKTQKKSGKKKIVKVKKSIKKPTKKSIKKKLIKKPVKKKSLKKTVKIKKKPIKKKLVKKKPIKKKITKKKSKK